MKNEKFTDFENLVFGSDDDSFKKPINIPMELLDIVERKFDVKEARKAYMRLIENYYKDDSDSNETYTVLDDFTISVKADDVETKYFANRFDSLTPLEDLYYSYENELKYAFPDYTYMEATLVSGDFMNMARYSGVPSWIIKQVLQAYEDETTSDNTMSFDIEFNVAIDTNIMRNLLKDSECPFTYANIEPFVEPLYEYKLGNYKKFMKVLKENNVPLQMYIRVGGYYDNIDECDLIFLDNTNKNGNIVKDCGTFNNFHFDYKGMIDSIYNELHK